MLTFGRRSKIKLILTTPFDQRNYAKPLLPTGWQNLNKMTTKDAYKKIYIAAQICYLANGLFSAISEVQKGSKIHILKEDVVEGLWDMTLKDIAKLLDTINPDGGSIPKDCRDILS